MSMHYLSRIADRMLRERLEAFGAVLIEGPKWTGKTTTAKLSKERPEGQVILNQQEKTDFEKWLGV